MKKIAWLLLALYVTCVAANISIAQEKNPTDWDILSVKIDNTIEEAMSALRFNIPNIFFEPKYWTYSKGNFVSPPFTFGVEGWTGSYPIWGDNPERIWIVCDQVHPKRVIAVTRVSSFERREKPSLNAVFKALVNKYGKPDISGNFNWGRTTGYCWFKNASEQYKDPEKLSVIYEYTVTVADMSRSGQIFPGYIDIKCGTLLSYFITHNISNKDIVDKIKCDLIDFRRIQNSDEYHKKLLRDFSERAAAAEKARGDRVKPKF